jgi:sirohydrochlorin cobaltochelatase
MTRGLVLFAHGARDARWAEPFESVATRVRAALPEVRVALAFLELMPPSLDQAAQRLAADGVTAIDVVPLFLGTGGHLRSDLPRLVDALRVAHPGLTVRLHAAIGEHVSVIEAMARAAVAVAADGFGE